MTIHEYYKDRLAAVSGIYPHGEARAILFALLESFAGIRRQEIALEPCRLFEPGEELTKAVDEILNHRPLQYVIGKAWFAEMEFTVNEHVLIPRPETEELVRWICSSHELPAGSRILDIGTGSGCIAIALAREYKSSNVTALDISSAALCVAKENSRKNGVPIKFCHADILSSELPENYDLVVSNPPYVCRSESSLMRENVTRFEPEEALFVPDEDPLLFYRQIVEKSALKLNPGGWVYFEINERFSARTAALLAGKGFSLIEERADIFGKPRFIRARWK